MTWQRQGEKHGKHSPYLQISHKNALKKKIPNQVYLLNDSGYIYRSSFIFDVGLVVKEAAYGPSEQGPEMEGLDVDVTIAVQALVHNSQLYIPGHRSKVYLLFSYHERVHFCWKNNLMNYDRLAFKVFAILRRHWQSHSDFVICFVLLSTTPRYRITFQWCCH